VRLVSQIYKKPGQVFVALGSRRYEDREPVDGEDERFAMASGVWRLGFGDGGLIGVLGRDSDSSRGPLYRREMELRDRRVDHRSSRRWVGGGLDVPCGRVVGWCVTPSRRDGNGGYGGMVRANEGGKSVSARVGVCLRS
jgi:hypothetical protein